MRKWFKQIIVNRAESPIQFLHLEIMLGISCVINNIEEIRKRMYPIPNAIIAVVLAVVVVLNIITIAYKYKTEE